GLDKSKDEVKGKYIELLNVPAVVAQGEGRWVTASRAVRAFYAGLHYIQSRGRLINFMPFAEIGKPFPGDDGLFYARLFGLVKSGEDEYQFEGPASIRVNRFASEETATAYMANFHPGTVYTLRGTPSNRPPQPGQATLFFVDGNQPPVPMALPTDPFWTNTTERLFDYFQPSPESELLLTPTPNRIYRLEAEIIQSRTGATRDGRPNGSITIIDDSVTKDVAKAANGGLSLWLPKDYIAYGALPLGSRVALLVEGYFKAEKVNNENTGNGQWRFNIYALKTLVDLSGGTAIPSPDAPAVQIPAAGGLRNSEL